ncbi:MAG: ferritin-like domain-containing protein [Candidatus Rokubacteria bacterium]|nr:ferritin-like domain-containing protein [Candidatus Rokubacteria bacterium]MBI2491726.1 ferritin-like domain-containing protein [Candidatus Rokubacteria bacterium]MBI4628032.1 ferritin-like domain-containing protein [Candidatus Rokubacteria bacterium]
MPHPLEGPFAVEHSARLLRNYRYVVERALRAAGGWIALTPELSAKLLLGRHVWDLAQHADAFGRRLPELRATAHQGEPANAAVVAFMDAVEAPEAPHETVERLVGVYRVLKPHLLAVYSQHLARANAVYEPPTRQILARCIEDETRHVTAGETILRHLVRTPELEARAAARQRRLEPLLAAAGGVTGDVPPDAPGGTASPAVETSDDAREWIRLERAVGAWPMPAGLADALRAFGGALGAGDAAAVARWLAPGTGWDIAGLGARAPRSSRIVAFARIGRQCVVKLALDGAGPTVTLQSRWVPGEAGWRAAALEILGRDPAPAVLPPR